MDPDCKWCTTGHCNHHDCYDMASSSSETLCQWHIDHDPENNL